MGRLKFGESRSVTNISCDETKNIIDTLRRGKSGEIDQIDERKIVEAKIHTLRCLECNKYLFKN